MPIDLSLPIIYLITTGKTHSKTTPEDQQFLSVLQQINSAVAATVSLIQIREKSLSTRVLYELTRRASLIVRETPTKLLVNDRFDVALAAGADGVHLTSSSISADVVRQTCGTQFLVGVSTHSLEETRSAKYGGADFVVFGPVFETESKRAFGEPQGVKKLREAVDDSEGLPVIAIGGISSEHVSECFEAGAKGIAAISLLNDSSNLNNTVIEIKHRFERQSWFGSK
jgi:thiamine-phosphate pyrophosphorylase